MESNSNVKKYALAIAIGAVAGGVTVAVVTRAFPKMMSGMMFNMMSGMKEEGFNPPEI